MSCSVAAHCSHAILYSHVECRFAPRVYLRTCRPEDKEFMRSMESAAVATAAASVALSRSDADFIRCQLLPSQKHAASVTVRSTPVPS